MKLVVHLFLLLQQAPSRNPNYTNYTRPTGTAFDGYLEPAGRLIVAFGALLAIMTAYRIYKNAMLHKADIYEGTVNMLTGMIFLVLIRVFIETVF